MEITIAGDDRLHVLQNDKGYNRAVAAVAIAEGEVLAPFGARETLAAPTYLTVQTDADTHILLAPEHLQYINHSCNPNVFFDTGRMEIRALRAIAPGEDVRAGRWWWESADQKECGLHVSPAGLKRAGQPALAA